jgi:NAD kinase
MNRLTENKIILITRATRLEELVARFNTLGQAKFYVESRGADFAEYEMENNKYKSALAETEKQLLALGRVQIVDRSFIPNFVFGPDDTIVVIGQDGLVVNTLKYLRDQAVIGVNPDPDRWDGILLPFTVKDVARIVAEVFARKRRHKEITMAKAALNNGQAIYGVNDLFIGPRSHTSIRYEIGIGSAVEQQSSSGIIVSTGLGSTGWFKSIVAGAVGIGRVISKSFNPNIPKNFSWDADYLYYTVREPFPSKTSKATIVFGKITEKDPMKLISKMPENGVIFSDGIEADYLDFNSGTQAVIGIAERKGLLVV